MSNPPFPCPPRPAHCPVLSVAVIDLPAPDKVEAALRWQRRHRFTHRRSWRKAS